MPTDVFTIADNSIHSKWKEPYASASVNRRPVGVTPPGIYRGLGLEEDPLSGDRTVVVAADATNGDHVAVYETSDGYSINYRDAVSGDLTISLTAYTSVTVVITIFIEYVVGSNTTGAFRVYTLAEYNALSAAARDELVVMGTVAVPTAGNPIPAASITLERRTLASQNIQKGAVQLAPIVRNPGFEIGEVSKSYRDSAVFWEKSVTSGVASWTTTSSDVYSGLRAIVLNVTSGTVTGRLSQEYGMEVVEGQIISVECQVKQLKTISVGTWRLFFDWGAADGSVLTTTYVDLDGAAVDSDYRPVSTFIAAPPGAVSLRSAGVGVTGLVVTAGDFALIDSFNLFVEPDNALFPYPFSDLGREPLSATSLVVHDAAAGSFSTNAPVVRYDSAVPTGEGSITVDPKESADSPPALAMAGRLYELGRSLIGATADAIKPRISAEPAAGGVSSFTLMWESKKAGLQGARFYAKSDGALYLTVNANWDGSQWAKDVPATEAVAVTLLGTSFQVLSMDGPTATWLDSAWSETTITTGVAGGITDLAQTLRLLTAGIVLSAGDLDVTAGDVNVDAGNLNIASGAFANIIGTLTGGGSAIDVTDDIASTKSLTLGTGLLSSDVDAETPRIVADAAPSATSQRTLIFESLGGTSGLNKIRVYVAGDDSNSLEVSLNARWDDSLSTSGQWELDSTNNAALFRFQRNRFEILGTSDNGPIDDSEGAGGWDRSPFDWDIGGLLRLGNEALSRRGYINLDGPNDAAGTTSPHLEIHEGYLKINAIGDFNTSSGGNPTHDNTSIVKNRLYANAFVKMQCFVQCINTSATVISGFNAPSASTTSGASSTLTVNLQVNILSGVVVCLADINTFGTSEAYYGSMSGTSAVDIFAYDDAARMDFQDGDLRNIQIIVCGLQTD